MTACGRPPERGGTRRDAMKRDAPWHDCRARRVIFAGLRRGEPDGYRSPDYSGALTAGFAGIPAYSIGTCIGTFEEE